MEALTGRTAQLPGISLDRPQHAIGKNTRDSMRSGIMLGAAAMLDGLLDKIEDKPYADAVNSVMLRSLQKARYASKNLGHFGLAAEFYCHFTSPIRRYPDLMIHRIIKNCILKLRWALIRGLRIGYKHIR